VRAEPRDRDAAAVRVFPPGVPAVTILLGLVLQRLWPMSVDSRVSPATRRWIGGLIVVGAILGLGLWSVILFRRSGQNENPWTPTPQIVERGPFRLSRNPMYLQMLLVCVGVALLLANVWLLLLTPLAGWVLHHFAIRPEEAYLERKFGQTYRAYKGRVRRWL
jgi:protein-S-isoprenylcysteine O-methyltransferase Ste14